MKRFFAFAICMFLLSGCASSVTGTGEGSAKKVLETYLEAMKKGDKEKAETYLEDGEDNLIDVFKYEYLDTLELDKEEEDGIYVSAYRYEDSAFAKEHKTWKDFLNHVADTYDDNDKYEVEYGEDYNDVYITEKGKYKDQHAFRYDMEIANGGGEKIYKKIEFTLEYTDSRWNGDDFEKGYVISDISIDGEE